MIDWGTRNNEAIKLSMPIFILTKFLPPYLLKVKLII